MSIEIRNVSKTFGTFKALQDVTLDVPTGELVALLGPSGSGKTTLLRIIAGLEEADRGSIHFYGEDATRRNVRDRHVGFVFQHYALFKHMTVFENIAFGLRVRPNHERPSDREISEKVHKLLKLIQLDWIAERFPSQLSGGQRQRVALARALAVEPKVLLLDEPFGALDAKVRKELRRWLRQLHDEVHVTSVFVTHDQEEALEVADRVVVMNEGRVEQIGAPDDVYARPANPFVYGFLGNVNLFHGRLEQGFTRIGALSVATPDQSGSEGAAAIYVRPHDVVIGLKPGTNGAIEASVHFVRAVGPVVRIELQRKDDGGLIEAELTHDRYRELGVKVGDSVYASVRNPRVFTEDFTI